MPAPQLTENPSATAAVSTSPAGSRGAVVRRTVVGVLVTAMLASYLIGAASTLSSAVGSVAGASLVWLLTGLAATALSMVAFAALRGRTLAFAGSSVPMRRTLAVSYGAGAVHTTLPVGAVFSTTYAFRHLRSAGASVPAATWSMAITGLLSTLSLTALGVVGLALSAGTGGSMFLPILEMVLGVAFIVAIVRLSHRPEAIMRCAHRGLIGINRLRRRPAQAGGARLSEIVADLQVIHPSGRNWAVAAALALANWTLDLACLYACCAAVGVHVGLPALLLTYTAGMAAGSLLPLPAGLGAVEAAMTIGLTVAAAAAAPALAAILLYRLLSTGSVVLVGWLVVAAQRVHTSGRASCAPDPARSTG